MKRANTPEDTSPSDPLRAKYVIDGKTVVIVTDASKSELRHILETLARPPRPPHWRQ